MLVCMMLQDLPSSLLPPLQTPLLLVQRHRRGMEQNRDDTDSVLDEALKQLRNMSPERGDENSDFGRVVDNDLGHMSKESRLYAQKLISDILYRGKAGKLTLSTAIMDI